MKLFKSNAATGLILCAALISGCASRNTTPAVTGRLITPQGSPSFTSPTGNYAIWFPVKPTENKQVMEGVEHSIVQAETKPVTYVIIYTPIPSDVNTSDTKSYLDSAQKGLLEGAQAKLVSAEDINLEGVPGREIVNSSFEGKALSRVRIYLTPRMSYQIMAAGLREEMRKNEAQTGKVLDSFRLLSKPS
jgi:hypothetical protein